jgi:ribonuclease VapC
MIAMDSSAVIAIMLCEAGHEEYVTVLALDTAPLMSAANYLESAMVLTRRSSPREELDQWLDHFGVDVTPVDLAQARLAADVFARYGRGRHPARLNYGDCFAYALAASRGIPLLYKGADFAKTDIQSALAAST